MTTRRLHPFIPWSASVGRRQGLCGLAGAEDGKGVPAAVGSGVGVCRPRRHDDAVLVGFFVAPTQAKYGGGGHRAGWAFRSQSMVALRRSRRCMAMDCELLSRQLQGGAFRRFGMDNGLQQQCARASRRFLEQRSEVRLRRPAQQQQRHIVMAIGMKTGRAIRPDRIAAMPILYSPCGTPPDAQAVKLPLRYEYVM